MWKLENDTIYTIGYEGLPIENFIRKLKDANIVILASCIVLFP